MILCNGIPKSGTHALLKAVQLLGEPDARQDHIPHGEDVDFDKHIYIRRDPRNMLVSWVRFTYPEVTKGYLIGAIKRYGDLQWSLPETIARFDGWMLEEGVLTVDFEKMVTSPQTFRRIADYLDVPYLNDAFANLLGGTVTWSGSLSRWEDHWGPEVENVWREYFGITDQDKIVSL